MNSIHNLRAEIQRQARQRTWSQGALLARAGAVVAAHSEHTEIVVNVQIQNRALPFEVVLYPADDDWECSCESRERVCSHVAAAIIHQATPQPKVPTTSPLGVIYYELYRRDGKLAIQRTVKSPEGSQELRVSLQAIVAKRAFGPPILPKRGDLEIDRLLPAGKTVFLNALIARVLIRELAGDSRVLLDGKPTELTEETLTPRAMIADHPQAGVVLRLEASPQMKERLGAGLALDHSGYLRPLAASPLAGEDHDHLPFCKHYPPATLGELATEVLPNLRGQMEVLLTSTRLPGAHSATPRIELTTTTQDGVLEILATLVYGDPAIARIDGDRLVLLGESTPLRNRARERELVDELRDSLHLVPGKHVKVLGSDAQHLASRLAAYQGQASSQPRPQLAAVWRDTENGPELAFVGDQGSEASAALVMAAHQAGLGVVSVANGFARIPRAWLDEHAHLIAEILAAREAKHPAFAAQAMIELTHELGTRPPDMGELSALIGSEHNLPVLPRAELPKDLTAKLRPYQQAGVDWLAFLREHQLGGLLADDMGLGKTVQALSVIEPRSLVICPRSVLWNWQYELSRFRPGLRGQVYHGAQRTLDDSADVVMTTYAVLRNDLDALSQSTWRLVILDEAQAIKNPSSQSARAAFALPAHSRFALSGTPVENRIEELWSLARFACPGLLPPRAEFRRYYSQPIGEGDLEAAKRLQKRLAPYMLRRKKADVAPELPPRTHALMHVELSEEERTLYNTLRAASQGELPQLLTGRGGAIKALEALLRLRQAACHPSLLPGQSATSSTKLEALTAALCEASAGAHRSLVFSQWTSFLDLVEPALEHAQLSWSRLDGKTKNRQAVVDHFQRDGGPPILLASLKAGGTGLNLTAADHVFLLDPWWNPAAEEQAADRAHRIGQNKPVFVYRMIAKNTVEERIIKLQNYKRSLAELTATDFQFLLAE